jgi:hypothetical protein
MDSVHGRWTTMAAQSLVDSPPGRAVCSLVHGTRLLWNAGACRGRGKRERGHQGTLPVARTGDRGAEMGRQLRMAVAANVLRWCNAWNDEGVKMGQGASEHGGGFNAFYRSGMAAGERRQPVMSVALTSADGFGGVEMGCHSFNEEEEGRGRVAEPFRFREDVRRMTLGNSSTSGTLG